ncbi:DUF1289 domain-containing protein [Lichenihabitans sp. Uapishka_5]|uniref:DUF1289 domain-containing protein n=1 Tax=Lichenihabitans sp. Uapishka_5 TaxID=3037302 RepID=UPI0029E7EC43|nr:DUF1289 domain-containing protein [Lichenihabitans sp. Uapishka_5]MDX7952311.1 DUF1289 domain-containing protein [Lichenihabitans sp. Uapishka_5]
MSAPSSPCVKLCIMDATSGLCCGCGRTLDEIVLWAGLDEAARRTVMRQLPGRMADAGLPPDAGLPRGVVVPPPDAAMP